MQEQFFLIPSKLAYGSAGYYTIPGYTPILFEVDLVKVKRGVSKAQDTEPLRLNGSKAQRRMVKGVKVAYIKSCVSTISYYQEITQLPHFQLFTKNI